MTTLDLRYSKDGGHNFSNWRQIDMGEVGHFVKRLTVRRLGQGRQWVFEVRVTDPVKADILAMSAQIEGSGP